MIVHRSRKHKTYLDTSYPETHLFLFCPETIFINSQPTFQRQNILHIFTNPAESTSAILSHWHLFLIIISKKSIVKKIRRQYIHVALESLFYICFSLFLGIFFIYFLLQVPSKLSYVFLKPLQCEFQKCYLKFITLRSIHRQWFPFYFGISNIWHYLAFLMSCKKV